MPPGMFQPTQCNIVALDKYLSTIWAPVFPMEGTLSPMTRRLVALAPWHHMVSKSALSTDTVKRRIIAGCHRRQCHVLTLTAHAIANSCCCTPHHLLKAAPPTTGRPEG